MSARRPQSKRLKPFWQMPERLKPAVYSIPPHRAFADALVRGVLDQHGLDKLSLARGAILLPNNRAVQAVRDAFVRQAERGLLLPRLVPIGDEDMDARLGAALEPLSGAPVPPAIDPLHRQLILAQLIQIERAQAVSPVDAAEAMRLAGALATVLDQLIVEGVTPDAITKLDMAAELSSHWQTSLDVLAVVLQQWPEEQTRRGVIDLTERRNRLLTQLATRWAETPPPGFVIAAGISTSAPKVGALLRVISRMPNGQVVLAGLDQHMSEAEWNEIGGADGLPGLEGHPQFHLHLLLDRMGVARGEVGLWRRASERDASAQRSRVLSLAMQPAALTKTWHMVATRDLRLGDVTALTCATPAHEAQTIALVLRHALEVPGQTVALVTPDRDLARRVVALLARWGVVADDSAGQPLAGTRIGGLILALTEAVVTDFAPVPLLTVLKHPLVQAGDARLLWLDGVRALDHTLRGPRPEAGLDGVGAFLAGGTAREQQARAVASAWWRDVAPKLAPLANLARVPGLKLPHVIEKLRAVLAELGGDDAWSGAAGHAAADLFAQLEALGSDGPLDLSVAALPGLLRGLMEGIAVRPEGALHPRIFIWGLLEAKLQTADIMVLGGLNEGVWPALPAPDPWLAPRIRHALGLPTLERRIGLSAHDLVGAMGAPRVLLTRARRDARAPAIASRFWLRLQALTGGLPAPDTNYAALAHLLDEPPTAPNLTKRPAPMVAAAHRPRVIGVTEVDTLNADPFGFYARTILRLRALDPVDAPPSAAWRGSLVHAALEAWAKADDYAPEQIVPQFEAAFANAALHPLLTALWLPRFTQAAQWIAQAVVAGRADGRVPLASEVQGELTLAGVTLKGRLDRVDRLIGDTLAIVDYKTGPPPTTGQVRSGFALQLGLIGIMAQRGAFPGVQGQPAAFEYWSLGRDNDKPFGYAKSALTKGQPPDTFLATTEARFRDAIETWLTGDAPFTAMRQPDYAYHEYDHLMRYDEWAGRDG